MVLLDEKDNLTDDQLDTISGIVKNIAGIDLHDGKKELIRARLAKRLRELKITSHHKYLEYLKNDTSGAELSTMLDILTTNVTSFFREADHFEYLKNQILTQAVSRAQSLKSDKKLRIWSAGCSSGEEPYTIAIVLNECLPDLTVWDAKILATDLSRRILSKAKIGEYGNDRVNNIPGMVQQKYFSLVQSKPEKRYRVHDELRRLIHFARLNLMESWPMSGPFDVIFCRNVMIYFDKQTQGRLINRFWEILSPGGTLFIGHSESLTGIKHNFHFVKPTVYAK
ncbi:MAG: protein-glutamate O-methyltransferase CheR [Planctomycetes bacterium]|nr:protein-glutamate O-methyltransferase CheR [Planctomycetota bacterium]